MKNCKGLIVLSFLILILACLGVSSEALTLESLLPKEVPEGWGLIDGPRTYTRRTLFEHVDGQAELFFKYGFQRSVFTIYQNRENPNHQIELDIYDMGNVLQAFGIFSRFRAEDRVLGIGLDSYLDDQSALFYKGKYFVMVYSTESNPSTLKQFSMSVALKITDHSPQPQEINFFPKNGLRSGSIQYFTEGLLGYQFLKRGFQGTYVEKVKANVEVKAEDKDKAKVEVENKEKPKSEDKEFHLFLAIFKNFQEAMSALKVFRDNLYKKGKIDRGSPSPFGSDALKGEDPYQGRVVIVPKGKYLLGVAGFEKEKFVEDYFKEFIRNTR